MKKEDDKVINFFEKRNKKETINTKEQTEKQIKLKKKTTKNSEKKAVKSKEEKRAIKQNTKTSKQSRNNRKKGASVQKDSTLKHLAKKTNKKIKRKTVKRRSEKIKSQSKSFSKTVRRKSSSRGSFWQKIINILLLALIFFAPFFFVDKTFQGSSFEKSIFFVVYTAIILLISLFKALITKEIRIKKTFLDKYIWLFLVVYGISAWFSIDRWHSLVGFFGDPSRGIITVLAIVIFFYLVLSNFSKETAKKAYWIVVSTGVITGVYTLLSSLALIPVSIQSKIPFSLLDSVTGLTVFLSAGLLLLITALLKVATAKKRGNKGVLWTMFLLFGLLLVVDLVILKTFMLWSGLIGGIVVLSFLIINKKIASGRKITKGFIFAIFVVLIVVAGIAKSNQQNILPKLAKIGLPSEIKVGLPVSYDIIKNSFSEGKKQIVLGSGPATFGYDFAKFHPGGAVSLLPTNLYQGDGLIAEGLPTIGILGTISLILFWATFLRKSFQAVITKRKDQIYLIGLLSASITWLINALLGQLDAGIIFWGVIILTLTTFFALNDFSSKKGYYIISFNGFSLTSFLGVLFLLGGLAFSVVVLAYSGKFYTADKFLNQAINSKDINKNIQNIKQAIKLNPREGVYYTKLGQAYLLAATDKINKLSIENGEKEQDRKNIQKDITASLLFLQQGAKLMPNDLRALKSLALTYEIIGDIPRAEKTYQRLIVLEPNGLKNYVSLGNLQLIDLEENKEEKLKRAINFYQRALTINPLVDDIYYRLAMIYSKEGDKEQAINNIARAVQLAPGNNVYKFTLGIFLQNRGGEKDLVDAEKIYKALLVINPKSVDVHTQLGSLYEQTGRSEEAKIEYKKVIEIIGDQEKYQNIKKAMEKFIENLDNGKSNIITNETENNQEEESDEKKNTSTETVNEERKKETEAKNKEETVTITVDEEGPINVRSEGSLQGEKLTKIKTTGQFKKLQEKGGWVQIVVPADGDNQPEIIGWVHSKFVDEE